MIPYDAQDAFTDIELYDTSDLVLGGLSGTSNLPLKGIIDRTLYLNNRQGRYEDVKLITGSYTYDPGDIRKLFAVSLTDNSAFTLPDPGSLPAGTPISIRTRYPVIKALTVQCSTGVIIGDDGQPVAQMYMHTGERLCAVAAGDHWEIVVADGNFYTAGYQFGGRKQLLNTIILQGQLIVRADMPRITQFGLSLGAGIVDDITWLSDPGGVPVYRGLFSTGNTVTTLRLPEERGMFDRYLDLGRGIDNGRFPNVAGGYEPDDYKKHSHGLPGDLRLGNGLGVRGGNSLSRGSTEPPLGPTEESGGDETRPKNIGKLPLMKY